MIGFLVVSFLIISIILYFVFATMLMNIYEKLGYRHAWFSFIPILNSYMMFKTIYDSLHVDKIIKEGRTKSYRKSRKTVSIIMTFVVFILSSSLNAQTQTINSTTLSLSMGANRDTLFSVSSLLITLVITILFFYALERLFTKTGAISTEKEAVKKGIIKGLIDTVTLGLASLYFYPQYSGKKYKPVVKDSELLEEKTTQS